MWKLVDDGMFGCVSHVYESFTENGQRITVIEIIKASSFKEEYTSYIISNPDKSDGVLDYINGKDLDILKFKSLLKANEMGWNLP